MLFGAGTSGARHTSNRDDGSGVDFIAGGTDLIQLMQEHVHHCELVVDITAVPDLVGIDVCPGGARLGALIRTSMAAADPGLALQYLVVTEALLVSASPQVRSLATLGGVCCREPDAVTATPPCGCIANRGFCPWRSSS